MKLVIICGPTATGKTDLAARLAKKFSGSIISADSRQVYKGMDIVTGKDRPKGVSIWGYDLVKPSQDFSVAHFVRLAREQIKKIHRRGHLPIVVGGTGFWLKALVKPPATINIKPNSQLRKKLEKLSIAQLRRQLERLDPERAANMNQSDRNNPRRLIRAIEVAKQPRDSLRPTIYDAHWIGLTAPLKVLDRRIEDRVRQRVKAGAIKEWERLCRRFAAKLPSMSAIGYRELPDIDQWVRAEKQYARRQLTWFKKNKAIKWYTI